MGGVSGCVVLPDASALDLGASGMEQGGRLDTGHVRQYTGDEESPSQDAGDMEGQNPDDMGEDTGDATLEGATPTGEYSQE